VEREPRSDHPLQGWPGGSGHLDEDEIEAMNPRIEKDAPRPSPMPRPRITRVSEVTAANVYAD